MCSDRRTSYVCGHRRHVQTLCDEYKSGRNDALFALRMTGRTSDCPNMRISNTYMDMKCPNCLEQIAARKRQRRRSRCYVM